MRVTTCLVVLMLFGAVGTLLLNVTYIISVKPTTTTTTTKNKKQQHNTRRRQQQEDDKATNNNNNNALLIERLETQTKQKRRKKLQHQIGGLSCEEAYGGPSDDVAAEMVYWRDIPSDHHFKNPFHMKHHTEQQNNDNNNNNNKYLTFEPDSGDWNNKRMGLETAAVLALVSGRILVLPPSSEDVFYDEIYPFQSIASEYNMKVITMEEFLKTEGHNLRDQQGNPRMPEKTNWDGDNRHVWDHPLWPYLRDVTVTVNWGPHECVAGFPDQPGRAGEERMVQYFEMATMPQQYSDNNNNNNNINHNNFLHNNDFGSEEEMTLRIERYTANPTPVDAPPQDRMREMLAERTHLCLYDTVMHESKYLHIRGEGPARMLSHFYVMLFFEDWRQDLWVKRFVRDHFRYVDELQCAAARIVEALHDAAVRWGNPDGDFYTFHIRRGDFLNFQGNAQVSAEEIYYRTRSVFEEEAVVYVATDERDKSFFSALSEHYQVYYLDDFQELIPGISMAKFGQLDQLVASKGRNFVGLYGSTFTGYINRMRAYHAMKDKEPGYEEGAIPSYYYAEREFKYHMRQYRSLAPPLWGREFPVAWRDIDHDLFEEDVKS